MCFITLIHLFSCFLEFVTVCMDQKTLLTKNRLKRAFEMFDTDQSGKISSGELQSVSPFFFKYGTTNITIIIIINWFRFLL